ncbi:MAG TPA: hypothetical protein PKC76_01695 [Saprospiraceae bacterium]|nr:hypothetical protein [Saprospiraceae bacterium]HMP22809.1 hypothetical protein [Saprospiraceae bacterium]
MEFRGEYRSNPNGSPFNSIVSIIFMVVFLVALYILARFVFKVLYYLSPLMLIATLIIDYKVLVNYVQWLVNLTRRNAVFGIGAIVLSLVFFPVVSALLLGRALFKRQVRKAQEAQRGVQEGDYVDFEEIPEEKPLKLPRTEKQTREDEARKDRYDQFFQ